MKKRIINSILWCLIVVTCVFQEMSLVAWADGTATASGGAVTVAGPGSAVLNVDDSQKNLAKNPGKKYKDIYEYVDDAYKDKSASYRKKVKEIIKGSKWYKDVGTSVSYRNRDKYLKKIVDDYNNGKTWSIDELMRAVRKYDGSSTNVVTDITDGVFGAFDYVDTVADVFTSGNWLPWVDEPEPGTAAWEFYNKAWDKKVQLTFETTDEMVDYIYGGSSKKTQELIKTYLDKNPSLVAGIKNNDGHYEPTTEFLGKLSNIEQRGTITSSVSSKVKGINNSESLAVGDMYAQDDNTDSYSTYVDEGPGTLEGEVAKLLTSLANGLNNLVGMCDGTLDKLVYGRLVYYGTNYFSFEPVKGNPYGIVGGHVYTLFRNLVIPFLILLLFSKFAKAAWSSGSGEQRRLFKDTLGRTVLMSLLVFLIPNIVDALIAIRDIVLNYLSSNLSTDMSTFFGLADGNDKTLIGYYKSNATNNGYLLDALLYLGVSFISIFYMITYISTAVAVMVSFMFFPLIVIFSFTENKMIDMWFKELLGNVFVPVLDAVLLLMPLMLNQFLPNNDTKSYLISFIACYSVIPSRAVIRGMLGVGGNIRSELLGFGALMGTMRMLSGIKNRVTGGVKGLWGAHKQNKADREMADMYADLARANGEGDQLTGRFASLGRLSSTEEKDNENGTGGLSSSAVHSNSIEDEKENPESVGDKPLQDENGQSIQKLDSTVDEDEKSNENSELGEDGVSSTVNASNGTETLESVGDGNSEDAGTEPLGNTGDVGKTEESALNGEGIAAASANEDTTNTGVDGAEARTPEEQREIDKKNVLKGYVNTDNFENKEFKNCLNFAERAKMHRQRANRNAINSALGAVGSVAGGVSMGALGAAAFGGATMFAGSRVNMTATTAGANMGSAVGSHIGGATGRTVGAMASGVHEVAKTGSSHPIRQSAARVGEMAIREAGVAPGVANKLYRATEGYKTKPNNSTFAHRLAFDPSQTTIPQRSSGPRVSYSNRGENGTYQNYSSVQPDEFSYQDNAFVQPDTYPQVGSSDKINIPIAKFDTEDSTLDTLGATDNSIQEVVEFYDNVVSDSEHPMHNQVEEQLERMKQEYMNKLLDEGMADEEVAKKMDHDYKYVRENHIATLAKNAIFDKCIATYEQRANACTSNQEKKIFMNYANAVRKQKNSDSVIYSKVKNIIGKAEK